MKRRNGWSVYLRSGTVYIPTVVFTTVYTDIAPVFKCHAEDIATLTAGLLENIRKGNVLVPQSQWASLDKDAVPKAAFQKSWTFFEKKALSWSISKFPDGSFEISPNQKSPDGKYWVEDPKKNILLPPGTEPEQVAHQTSILVNTAFQTAPI